MVVAPPAGGRMKGATKKEPWRSVKCTQHASTCPAALLTETKKTFSDANVISGLWCFALVLWLQPRPQFLSDARRYTVKLCKLQTNRNDREPRTCAWSPYSFLDPPPPASRPGASK